jgi:hypothetical protein
MTEPGLFRFSTVAHLEIPVGRVATDLAGLGEGIAAVPLESLFHHVTRIGARHPRARDLPANDFARWVGTALQDPETAERLAFAGAAPLQPIEDLRAALLRILGSVSKRRQLESASESAAFHFVRARSVVIPLGLDAERPDEVIDLWQRIDLAATFYHLVEARVIGPASDDLARWLRERGAGSLADAADSLSTAGLPLARLRREIAVRWRRSQIPKRLVRRIEISEEARRSEERAAAARLAGRLRGSVPPKPDRP